MRDYRQKFDPEAGYTWCRATRAGGKDLAAGDSVDKSLFPGYKLEQLWKGLFIERDDFVPEDVGPSARRKTRRKKRARKAAVDQD